MIEKKPEDELKKIKGRLDFVEQVLPLTGQSAFASNIPSPIIGEPPSVCVYASDDTFTYRTLLSEERGLQRTGVEITLQNSTDTARFLAGYNNEDGGVPREIQDILDRLVKLGGIPKEADFEFVDGEEGDEDEG